MGCAITHVSKCSLNPTEFHCGCLKSMAEHLRATKHWGIAFHWIRHSPDLPDEPMPEFPKSSQESPKCQTDTAGEKLACFVDAAHGNNLTERRSNTGCASTHCGGAMLHQSKAQSMTTLSSMEAKLIAAVTAVENAKCIRSVLAELGIPKSEQPTPICKDNKSAVETINANKPTGRSRCMDIRFFAIQDWKDDQHTTLRHTPGVVNPADDSTEPLGCVSHSRHARHTMGHRPMVKLKTSL